jgi:hypothetical protein
MAEGFGFDRILSEFQRNQRKMVVAVGNMALREFVGTFEKQGWEGTKWQEVQRRIPGTRAFKYAKRYDVGGIKRPILIGKSGGKDGAHKHLRAGVNNSLSEIGKDFVLFVVKAGGKYNYAERHNEGLDGMPKRQFIGYSRLLAKRFEDYIDSEMANCFRKA